MTAVVTVFRVLTSITSIVMLLSPSPSIYNIYKTKSTGVASIVPIVTMFSNAHAIVMFGYLTEQYFPVVSTFAVGEVLSLIYVAVFYRYTREKHKAHKVFLLSGIPMLLVTVYAFLVGFGVTGQSRHAAGNIAGYVTIVTSCLLYSAPMERISHVLRHRSAVFINFHMITAGTVNNVMWIVYSSMVQQWIIFSPTRSLQLWACSRSRCTSLSTRALTRCKLLTPYPSTSKS